MDIDSLRQAGQNIPWHTSGPQASSYAIVNANSGHGQPLTEGTNAPSNIDAGNGDHKSLPVLPSQRDVVINEDFDDELQLMEEMERTIARPVKRGGRPKVKRDRKPLATLPPKHDAGVNANVDHQSADGIRSPPNVDEVNGDHRRLPVLPSQHDIQHDVVVNADFDRNLQLMEWMEGIDTPSDVGEVNEVNWPLPVSASQSDDVVNPATSNGQEMSSDISVREDIEEYTDPENPIGIMYRYLWAIQPIPNSVEAEHEYLPDVSWKHVDDYVSTAEDMNHDRRVLTEELRAKETEDHGKFFLIHCFHSYSYTYVISNRS